MVMLKFAPEGYPFIAVFAALSVLSFWIGGAVAAAVPLGLTVFMLSFFRDPDRAAPDGRNLFAAPADGKVIVIKDVHEPEYLKKEVKQISIFMSPFNVHVNRVPCDGKVMVVKHTRGRYLAAYKDEASMRNEHIDMVLETRYGEILVRQVAGFVARRAVCRVKEGDVLQRGERYGIIKFSSRVDIYMPKKTTIKVLIGDRVKAGETVLGEIGEDC
jgi:phosphatidylserine decarboxylase